MSSGLVAAGIARPATSHCDDPTGACALPGRRRFSGRLRDANTSASHFLKQISSDLYITPIFAGLISSYLHDAYLYHTYLILSLPSLSLSHLLLSHLSPSYLPLIPILPIKLISTMLLSIIKLLSIALIFIVSACLLQN